MDGCLITLGRPLDGFLDTVLDGTQDAATMGRMVADAEDPLDHLGDPLGGPDLPAIAKRLRAACQHFWQLGHLLSTQLALRARRRVTTQSLHSLGSASFEPLADCPFAHSQSLGNVFLLPALL